MCFTSLNFLFSKKSPEFFFRYLKKKQIGFAQKKNLQEIKMVFIVLTNKNTFFLLRGFAPGVLTEGKNEQT